MESGTAKSPELGPKSPPRTQPAKSFSFANGSLKRQLHPPGSPPPPPPVVSYRECLKNHAASIGGYSLDGCGEFMPAPTANPADPSSLKCAACGCHRNFHRRDPDEPSPAAAALPAYFLSFHHRYPQPPPRSSSPSGSPTSPPRAPSAPHMLLALSSAMCAPQDEHRGAAFGPAVAAPKDDDIGRRKRFRTKFSQEQKEKMYLFSEKLGWKMHKSDDKMVEEFCKEIGVGRGVLKVWMHNNKHSLRKREVNSHGDDPNRDNAENNRLCFDTNIAYSNNSNEENPHNEDDGFQGQASANGSSSSS